MLQLKLRLIEVDDLAYLLAVVYPDLLASGYLRISQK